MSFIEVYEYVSWVAEQIFWRNLGSLIDRQKTNDERALVV